MRYPLRILVVEDLQNWRKALREELHKRFNAISHYGAVEIDTAEDGDEALALLKAGRKYDLVTLDINLDPDSFGAPGPSGLDVLEEIAVHNAAFFVVIVTSTATDATLEKRYGPEVAAVMQVGLQCEAAQNFPPERVRVINKPDGGKFVDQWTCVLNILGKVIDAYEKEAEWRYVFRPLSRSGKFWELRWDGGVFYKGVKDIAGFAELRYILKSIDRDDELTVVEMMARVQETLVRKRGGGARGRRKKSEENQAGEEAPVVEMNFNDVVKKIENGFLTGEIKSDQLPTLYEWLGTTQFRKVREAMAHHANNHTELGPLGKMMDQFVKDEAAGGSSVDGKIRLIIKKNVTRGGREDEQTQGHKDMMGAFRQQRHRVKKLLKEIGLEEMARHFETAINCGERNPGLCPYDPNCAVRWVLD